MESVMGYYQLVSSFEHSYREVLGTIWMPQAGDLRLSCILRGTATANSDLKPVNDDSQT